MHISPWTLMRKVLCDFSLKLLFWSMSFEGDSRSVKVFRLEFLTLKHPIWEHLPKFILKKFVKVSDNNSMRLSYADIIQHNTELSRTPLPIS